MERWEGKVAVVTGASAGIGAAIVEVLAKAGVQVVALARRQQNLEELAAKLSGAKGKVYPKACDLAKQDDITNALQWVETTLGGIDILINNAGYSKFIKAIDDTPESFRQLLDVNVFAMALTSKIAVASMKRRNVPGSIINLNSVAGHIILSGQFPCSLYSVCKFGITALSESLRQELANEPNNNIRVTNLSPGAVKTEFVEAAKFPNSDQVYNHMAHLDPIDVANAVLFILGAPQSVLVSELTIRPINEKF